MFRRFLALLTSAALAMPAVSTPAFADQRGYDHRHGAGGPIHRAVPRIDQSTDQQGLFGGNASTLAILGGLAALAAIAKSRRDDDDDDRADNRYTHSHGRLGTHSHREGADHRAEHRRRGDIGRGNGRGHGHGRGRDHARLIPAGCFRTLEGRGGGIRRGYGARCMQRNVSRPGLLPPRCLQRIETRRGVDRYLYAPNCLRNQGWRQARR